MTSVAPLPVAIADGVLGCLLVMSFAFVYVYMGDELFIVIPSIINAFEHICIDISICFMALGHKDMPEVVVLTYLLVLDSFIFVTHSDFHIITHSDGIQE